MPVELQNTTIENFMSPWGLRRRFVVDCHNERIEECLFTPDEKESESYFRELERATSLAHSRFISEHAKSYQAMLSMWTPWRAKLLLFRIRRLSLFNLEWFRDLSTKIPGLGFVMGKHDHLSSKLDEFEAKMDAHQKKSRMPHDEFVSDILEINHLPEKFNTYPLIEYGTKVYFLRLDSLLDKGEAKIVEDAVVSVSVRGNYGFGNSDCPLSLRYQTKKGHSFSFDHDQEHSSDEWFYSSSNLRMFTSEEAALSVLHDRLTSITMVRTDTQGELFRSPVVIAPSVPIQPEWKAHDKKHDTL